MNQERIHAGLSRQRKRVVAVSWGKSWQWKLMAIETALREAKFAISQVFSALAQKRERSKIIVDTVYPGDQGYEEASIVFNPADYQGDGPRWIYQK